MSATMRLLIMVALFLGAAFAISAEDFQELPEPDGNITAINCDLSDEPFAQMQDGTTISLREYFEDISNSLFEHCGEIDESATFNVNINAGTNIRDAASTQSNIVGKGEAGVVYVVYSSTEGDRYTWLEIRYDGQPAFVAEQLTVLLPDVILEENADGHQLAEIPCIVAHSTRRGSRTTVQAVEYGTSRAEFDVIRQSDQASMRLLRSDYDADTDGTYFRYGWQSAGSYTLHIDYRGESDAVGFVIKGTKTHFLLVRCE